MKLSALSPTGPERRTQLTRERVMAAAALASALGASHPYVVEMALAVTHGGALGRCDDDAEFEFALDFILDGLARMQSG